MPKALHDALEREARKRGLTGASKDAFVYGTMRNRAKAQKAKRNRRRK